MIVCMDYTQDGSRTISELHYTASTTNDIALKKYANQFLPAFDEVYIVDFDPNNTSFIEEIVLHGCRITE